MMSFPRKRETIKRDVMGGRVDTRLRGYDIQETGMTTYDVFPAEAGNQKKVDVLREGEWIPVFTGMTVKWRV